MQLTIILTSYNRPRFVVKAIQSIIAQTSPDWRLIIQDDGSDQDVLDKIRPFARSDDRITLFERDVVNRSEFTRYAVLINETLPMVKTELVCYMCDNVEYMPEMVECVLSYFKENQDAGAGYIYHKRDMWTPDGSAYLGRASDFAHWDYTPPVVRDIYIPMGAIDHSQVVHRMPVKARWDEDISAVKCGDGLFFQKLIIEKGVISPIKPGKVLSLEHLIK